MAWAERKSNVTLGGAIAFAFALSVMSLIAGMVFYGIALKHTKLRVEDALEFEVMMTGSSLAVCGCLVFALFSSWGKKSWSKMKYWIVFSITALLFDYIVFSFYVG